MPAVVSCPVCGQQGKPDPKDVGAVRGNTERFRNTTFPIWKCPRCLTLVSASPVDLRDIYSDYPLSRRRLDVFARGTMRNLLKRLRRAGLRPTDSILDYGCGNGIFLQFLREQGYTDVTGYDPYVAEYSQLPARQFDCVVANDVIEHCEDPRALIRECAGLVRPGGLLYIGTADSEPVDVKNLEPHIMRMHQPFHRLILTQKALEDLATEPGLERLQSYRRSYMDTHMPFANYRFLDEFNKALGHNMDRAFDPTAGRVLFRKPSLWFYAFFGYFFPSAAEPAVVLRKPR
jgi:SAM-dependent methyltransferase